MSSGWDLAIRIFGYIGMGVRAGDAVKDSYDACIDPELSTLGKVHRLGTNLVATGTSIAHTVVHEVNRAPPQTKIALASVKAGAGVAQTLSRKATQKRSMRWSDGIEVMVAIIAEGGCVAHVVRENPSFSDKDREICDTVHKTTDVIANLLPLANRVVKYREEQKVGDVAVPVQEELPLIGQNNLNELEMLQIDGEPFDQVRFNLLQSSSPIEDFEEIPFFIREHKDLQIYLCAISGEPIRHLLVVKSTILNDSPVYYDRKNLESYLRDHPESNPPGWPEPTLYEEGKVVLQPALQRALDATFARVLQQFREGVESRAKFKEV